MSPWLQPEGIGVLLAVLGAVGTVLVFFMRQGRRLDRLEDSREDLQTRVECLQCRTGCRAAVDAALAEGRTSQALVVQELREVRKLLGRLDKMVTILFEKAGFTPHGTKNPFAGDSGDSEG